MGVLDAGHDEYPAPAIAVDSQDTEIAVPALPALGGRAGGNVVRTIRYRRRQPASRFPAFVLGTLRSDALGSRDVWRNGFVLLLCVPVVHSRDANDFNLRNPYVAA